MALIKPVYGPDYGNLLMQGLGAYQKVKGIQAADVKAQREKEMFEDLRFRKERALMASDMRGMSQPQRMQLLEQHIQKVKERGGDPSNSQSLYNMYASNDPAQIQQADQAVGNAYVQGIKEGFTKAPPVVKKTSLESNLIAAGYTPGTPEYQQAAQRYIDKPQTMIDMGGAGTEQKELGKLRAQGLKGIRERGDVAQSNLASLDILDNIDVSTGKAEPMKQTLAAWGQSFGVDTSKLSNVAAGEAFTAEAAKVVLNAMAAQKGPQTESDMRQIRTTVSGLGKTPEANKFINNSARALSLRAIEQRDFYDNYLSENDTLKGASKAWNNYKRNIPMISRYSKANGLPIFYFQFEQRVQEANPGASRQEIIKEWNRQENIAKQERGR